MCYACNKTDYFHLHFDARSLVRGLHCIRLYKHTTGETSYSKKKKKKKHSFKKFQITGLWLSCVLFPHPDSQEHLLIAKYLPGIVPSSVVLTAFQVMSRVFLTWAVTHSVKEGWRKKENAPVVELFLFPQSTEFGLKVQTEDSVLLFVVAWTITEIIRYSFYTFSLLNHLPYLIKWARYTLFIVLYPMGVSGELLTIYAALPFVRQSGLYSISLPNKYNFSFDYYTFLILVMISYIPIFPQLYFHMLHQRRKVLSHTEEHKKSE
ncbi:very-long-chain (3R)-3-hydroxyacyl-CoA dehydratase 2 isoform 1-T1 [Chlamydotis macqueenii]